MDQLWMQFSNLQIESALASNLDGADEITRLAGHINAAQHRFLTLLAALNERDAWEGNGIKSPAHWLNYHCGIDLGAAREKVRVAKGLSTLPAIDDAFRTCTISYSKVRAMTRSATPENEQMLLQMTLHGTRRRRRLNESRGSDDCCTKSTCHSG
jgi:hypothetical protein